MIALLLIMLLMFCLLVIFGIGVLRLYPSAVPLIPLIGIMGFIFFGTVPSYWIRRFSMTALLIGLSILLCVTVGVVVWRNKKTEYRIRSIVADHIFPLLVLVLLTLGLLYGSNQFAVPGGIDSAIHANLANIIALEHKVAITYPLGMHFFILFITSVFHIQVAQALLSMNLLMYVGILGSLYCIFFIWTRSRGFALLGMLAGIIDASAYNNYLNGSFTHLLGTLLILSVIPFMYWSQRVASPWIRGCLWMMFFTAVFYIHFISILFILPGIWLLRWLFRDGSWSYVTAMAGAMIIGIPLFLNFTAAPGFSRMVIPAAILILVVDVTVTRALRIGTFLLQSPWVSRIAAILAVVGFYYTYTVFHVVIEWYGPIILALSLLCVVLALIRRDKYGNALIFYGVAIVAINSLFLLPFVNLKITFIQELVYYYGYSALFMVMAGYAMIQMTALVRNMRVRLAVVASFVILPLFIYVSRAVNLILLTPYLTVSRYANNDGFGIFYSRSDVHVAEWAKAHTPRSAIIANPGGLYNSWAVLSGRYPVYYAYDRITVSGGAIVNDALQSVLANRDEAKANVLIDNGIEYILLPENFSTSLFDPAAELIYSEGRSRLYQLKKYTDSTTRLYNLLDTNERPNNITLDGTVEVQCQYCGNRFYYQFEKTLHQFYLPPKASMEIRIDNVLPDDVLSIETDPLFSGGEVSVDNATKKSTIQQGKILTDYSSDRGLVKISISNTDESPVILDSLVLLVMKKGAE